MLGSWRKLALLASREAPDLLSFGAAVPHETLDQWNVPRTLSGVAIFEDFSGGYTGNLEAHTHAELELHLILRGSCSFIVENERFDAPAGSLVWVPPKVDHHVFDVEPNFRRWVALFRPHAIRAVLPRTDARRLLRSRTAAALTRQLTVPVARGLERNLAEARDMAFGEPSIHNAGVHFALARAWHVFGRENRIPSASPLHPAVVRAVHALRHESSPHSVRQLAKQCGSSPARLSRLFAEQVGSSITDFRNRLRIERFIEIYGGGERHTMTSASLEAGFGSYAQFYRVLRQVLDVTPAEFRRRAPG